MNFDFFQNTYKLSNSIILLQNNNSPSVEQVIQKMRDDMIRTQSTANTTAILGFDNLVEQLKIFSQQILQKNSEITRLQELCKKNKIDYDAKPQAPKITAPSKNNA